MIGWTTSELSEYIRYHDRTVELLSELVGVGCRSKTMMYFGFCCYPGTATWHGTGKETGFVVVHQKCEPGAIAHELGHGFHERLRDKFALDDEYGEDYAEAIRWFVEDRLHNTQWCENFKRLAKDDVILKHCGYDWEQFKEKLRKEQFYPDS